MCGKDTKGELRVYRDGEQVGEEVLEDDEVDEVDLSRGEEKVFLYDRDSEDELYGFEWNPRTINLTHFTGIGEKTAKRLTDLRKIDEMVDGDEGLSERVEEAVSAQYVDDLTEEIESKFEEAVENRDGDDLKKLEHAIEGDRSWWRRRECFDGVGRREQVADKLERAKGGGEVLIQMADGETLRATVGEDKSASEGIHHFELRDAIEGIEDAKIYVYRKSSRKPSIYDDGGGLMNEKVGVVADIELVDVE